MNEKVLRDTISALYDAALQEESWERVIDLTNEYVGLDVGMGRIADFRTVDSTILGYTGHSGEMYKDDAEHEILTNDPWARAIGFQGMNDIFIGSRAVDPKIYMKTPLFAEYMPSFDIGVMDGLGTCLPIGDRAMAYFIVYRRMGGDFIQDDEIERYSHLHGHIQRSLNITHKLANLRGALQVHQSLLDTLPYGVFGLSANKKIILRNRPGDRQLSDGGTLGVTAGELVAARHEDNSQLQMAIEQALGPSPRSPEETFATAASLKLYPAEGGRPWTVLTCPVSARQRYRASLGIDGALAAIVCVSDHAPILNLRVEQIANVYGLTPAEERLTTMICNGVSLPEFAAQSGRSINTLKTQLKHVFEKTEVRSQQGLMRLVLSAPLGL